MVTTNAPQNLLNWGDFKYNFKKVLDMSETHKGNECESYKGIINAENN